MKLVNLIPLKEIDFRNQDAFDDYNKKHKLRPDTKVTIDGKPTTAGQAAKNSEPAKGTSVFGKDSGGSVFGKAGGASAKSDKTTSASKEPTSDIDSLTSYEDFNKFFKANSDKLNKNDLAYIEDEIGALKYLESDYKKGKADRQEVEVAYVELQDLIKKALPKDTSKADVKSIVKGILKTADKEFAGTHKLKDITDDITIDTSDNDGKELQARIDKGEDGIYVQTGETEGTVVFNDGSQYQFAHVEDGPIPVTKVGPTKLSSMIPKSASGAKNKSITDIKVDAQVDVSMVSKSLIPNIRLGDGSGRPDKDAIELTKRLVSKDSGVYTRTSPHGGNIVFKDGTRFEVFRPHDAQKTKSTTIYASKR
jgi:hypothetical protein